MIQESVETVDLNINNNTCRTYSRLSIFIIWAVDIFQCFCWAVAIWAVVHFDLKLASAQKQVNPLFFTRWPLIATFDYCSTSVAQARFWCWTLFWAVAIWPVDPSPLSDLRLHFMHLQLWSNKRFFIITSYMYEFLSLYFNSIKSWKLFFYVFMCHFCLPFNYNISEKSEQSKF